MGGRRLSPVRAQSGVYHATLGSYRNSERKRCWGAGAAEEWGDPAPGRRREAVAGAVRGGTREMWAGFGRRAAGVAMRSGARRAGEGGPARQRAAPTAARPPGHGSSPAAPLPALSPAEPPLPLPLPVPVPVPCPPRSCWTTRPPCGDTAPLGAAARSWASSACWWAMAPWARPAWSSATPPTGTPTSTSPPPSTPSPVGARPGSAVPRSGEEGGGGWAIPVGRSGALPPRDAVVPGGTGQRSLRSSGGAFPVGRAAVGAAHRGGCGCRVSTAWGAQSPGGGSAGSDRVPPVFCEI